MTTSLWFIVGIVPEDGDCALVWASDEAEALVEGRKVLGYGGDPEYENSDFQVRPATAEEILLWCPALINQTATIPVESDVLDTEDVRSFLAEKIRSIQGSLATG